MSRRADEIRRRIRKRRKYAGMYDNRKSMADYDVDHSIFESDPQDSIHPLWNRNLFLFKMLCAALLFLTVAIIYQSPSPSLDQTRTVIQNTMEKPFQFALVGDWYEETFGKPLALIPPILDEATENVDSQTTYALPVTGKVVEEFSVDGRGIMLEAHAGEQVKATSGGVVIFAGKMADLEDTVIVQHGDQSETWYGKLDIISVKPHERVEAGTVLGTVSGEDDVSSGLFYFAIKQYNEFIDPIQVMKFE